MPNVERSSLNRTLTSMCLAAAASALLVAYLAFALATVLGQRAAERRQLAALTAVVARSSLDPLQFNDRRLATQILSSLEAQGTVRAAVLYDRKGRSFVVWRAPGEDAAGLDDPLPDLAPETLAAATRAGN